MLTRPSQALRPGSGKRNFCNSLGQGAILGPDKPLFSSRDCHDGKPGQLLFIRSSFAQAGNRVVTCLVAVFLFFWAFGGSNFASLTGAASWLNVAASLGIIAFPIGLLMIAGELDISIGSMILASSMTIAIISGHYDGPIWLGILAALALGALVGLINGVLVVRTVVPSFIVTLGTLFAAGLTLGLSVLLTGTTSVAIKAAQRPSFFWATSSAAAIRSPSCGGSLLLPCFGSSCTIPNTATGFSRWVAIRFLPATKAFQQNA